MTMAIWGNDYNYNLKTEKEVVDFFSSRGIPFSELIKTTRTYSNNIPNVENLIGPNWELHGCSMARVDANGVEEYRVDGPGVYTVSHYWGQFETAESALQRAIAGSSYNEFQSAVVSGIASIESYVNYRALEWNKINSTAVLDLNARLSLDEKTDIWLPIMLQGKKMEKGLKYWSDYMQLKSIRDNLAVHAKFSVSGINYFELAKLINLYRNGIAGSLIALHKLFSDRVPRVIIRRYYAPEVQVGE